MESGQKTNERPKINYQKLLEICQRAKNESDPLAHEQFMKEYHQLFLPPIANKKRPRSWSEQSRNTTHAVMQTERVRTLTSFGSRRSNQTIGMSTILKARLNKISQIITKHPPLRTIDDVKKLACLLAHFPELLPVNTSTLVQEEIAARAILERVHDRKGIALPREGGKYLVVHGRVQEIMNDIKQGVFKTRMLYGGEVFGEMKETGYPVKHSYPIYIGEKRTLLLRISISDVKRSQEIVEERLLHDHIDFINSSSLLVTFPLYIRQKLAKHLQWKNIPAKTKVLEEGEAVTHVSIIKEGHCKIFKTTTNAFSEVKVCIGEIKEGDCIGELVFEKYEIAPYTVVAETNLCVGQIPVKVISTLGFEKLQSPSRQYTISLPSEEMLQRLYAKKQVLRQWQAFKKSIVGEIYSKKIV